MQTPPIDPHIAAILSALASGGAPVGNNPANDLPLLSGLQIQKNFLNSASSDPGSPTSTGPAFDPLLIAKALGKGQNVPG